MTIKNRMAPVHPGEVLREELDSIGLSASAMARAIDVPVNRVTSILNGNRGVTADTALRLGRYFSTSERFWLNLQQTWEIRRAEIDTGAQILERVVSRETEALRQAAQAARKTLDVSTQAAASLRALERNTALCDQLNAIERSLRDLGANNRGALEATLRSSQSCLHELRCSGAFDTALGKLELTHRWLADYEKRFRLPTFPDISRTLDDLNASSEAMRRAIGSMKSPWLDVANESGSVKRLRDLQGIGDLLSRTSTPDSSVAEALRTNLGDWRDPISWPRSIWTDLGARADFYIDQGFDVELTDMPAPAFVEVTEITSIRPTFPCLADDYGPPVPPSDDPAEERALTRTNKAHDWLQRLESHLRRFIDRKMSEAFGEDWPRHQLPNNVYGEWLDKKEKADRDGTPGYPVIAYADFSDYVRVICKRDNWRVFKPYFKRQEDVRECFQRLHPIRLDTMHSRAITQDDELLLYVEAKRLIQRLALGGDAN